jgi:hypothetical protein
LHGRVICKETRGYTSRDDVAASVRADDLATARTIHPARRAGSVIAEQNARRVCAGQVGSFPGAWMMSMRVTVCR